MRRSLLFCMLGIGLTWAVYSFVPDIRQATAEARSIDPVQVSRGAQTYAQYCQQCHGRGLRATGLGMRSLAGFRHDKSYLTLVLDEGIGDMPPFSGVFEGEQVNDLYAYLSTTQDG